MSAIPAVVGWTIPELAKLIRIGPGRIRTMIRNGILGAINTSPVRCGRPRYVILPHHLEEWERRHRAATVQPKTRRGARRQEGWIDFFPD
jgi:hypothetical protein